jgi:hypothetical protein
MSRLKNFVITPVDQPTITVDNLEVARFIYLLLNHKKLRDVFNAVTEQGALILGRFGGGGLEILPAIAAPLALKVAKYYDKLDAEEDCHKTCIIVHSSIDKSLPPMRHHHLVSSKSNIRGGVQKGRTPMHARRTTFPTLPEEVNVC